jgi:hypothetical protein
MSKILRLPAHEPRVESGVLQFGDDWPGVFVRGDDALVFAAALRETAQHIPASERVLLSQLAGLANILQACSVGNTGWPLVPQPDEGEDDG